MKLARFLHKWLFALEVAVAQGQAVSGLLHCCGNATAELDLPSKRIRGRSFSVLYAVVFAESVWTLLGFASTAGFRVSVFALCFSFLVATYETYGFLQSSRSTNRFRIVLVSGLISEKRYGFTNSRGFASHESKTRTIVRVLYFSSCFYTHEFRLFLVMFRFVVKFRMLVIFLFWLVWFWWNILKVFNQLNDIFMGKSSFFRSHVLAFATISHLKVEVGMERFVACSAAFYAMQGMTSSPSTERSLATPASRTIANWIWRSWSFMLFV